MKTITEGKIGFDSAIIYYPQVNSCITVTCICSDMICGIHGTQAPGPDHAPIAALLNLLKNEIKEKKHEKLIIACDTDFWGKDGHGIARYYREHAKDFNSLTNYLLDIELNNDIYDSGIYDDSGIYEGICEVVNLGKRGHYYDTCTGSASFFVLSSGHVIPYSFIGDLDPRNDISDLLI